MLEVILKRFEDPDETRIFEKGRFEIVKIGDAPPRPLPAGDRPLTVSAGVTVHPVAGGNHGLAVRKGDPPALDAVAERVRACDHEQWAVDFERFVTATLTLPRRKTTSVVARPSLRS